MGGGSKGKMQIASRRITEDHEKTQVASGVRKYTAEWDTSEWDADEQDQGCQPYPDSYDQEMATEPPTVEQPPG